VLGRLITLEGIDGSGKSTVARELAKRLPDLLPGRRLVFTSEPTSSEAGRILRAQLAGAEAESPPQLLLEELFLFLADHADHLARTVIPSLNKGALVISDRYSDSTAAYQGVTLRGIVPDPVPWIRDISRPWNVTPDLTMLFVLDPAKACERLVSRTGLDKFERLDFLKSVDGNFQRLAQTEPRRFAMVDAGLAPKAVADRALSLILDLAARP
jgi:dTMP kinase